MLLFIGSVLWVGCSSTNSDDVPTDDTPTTQVVVSEEITLNPSGFAPLSALIDIETSENVRVDLRVVGRSGVVSDVVRSFESLASTHQIPVHGLYADFNNTVELTFFDASGANLGTKSYQIQTTSLIADMPQITIQTAERDRMAPGMTLVSYFGHAGAMTPQRPFIFDSFGDIRWYLDFKSSPILGALFFDDGMERLANGNFYFGFGNFLGGNSPHANKIYEIDLFGNIVNTWEMPGFGFHHEVSEKPNGNFLVTVNKLGASTIEDFIIEIDRNSKQIINEWDLNESLDNTRTTLTTNLTDWIHVNALTYDSNDDSIIISGRTQGTFKLTQDNEVVWIMAQHKDWDLSPNGVDLTQYLLQPLDNMGENITDQAVLDGDENHPDFEWNWYQHAPQVMPNGNIMLFDNGDNRNFVGNTYSRAVEYKVDTANKTIQQVWQYGKERDAETYSRIVSDVDYIVDHNSVLFSPGAVAYNGGEYGKSIEVDYDTKEVLFEATITPPISVFQITFHRTERLTLYPDN